MNQRRRKEKKQQIQKQYFHPLEEHRPWCLWITKDKELGVLGYQRLISCVEAIVKQTENINNFAEQVVSVFFFTEYSSFYI
ncbi:hypothetical protein E2C01_065821 [Portunus trituberculatus]|uniref:Uncharacterized protein n=1 Tax=Portunus trituberculatus TaxID=210409 RepID=A0A5B7HN50_PORTR|nr:hypothetical protein [Portunus trituberculatus]